MTWGTEKEIETRRRIRIAVWAYAYEILNAPVVCDAQFDIECQLVDLRVETDRLDLDYWFHANFDPCTGQWIHIHPDLNKIAQLHREFYAC